MSRLIKNNVSIIGDHEQTIIFAHGYGCDQTMWKRLLPFFTKSYRCIVFDHVGFGQSDLSSYNPNHYDSLEKYADDLNEILLSLKIKKTIFVGHSIASTIGILAANKHPELYSSLILIAPSPCFLNIDSYEGGFDLAQIKTLLTNLDRDHLSWSEAVSKLIMGNDDKPELAKELGNSFCKTDHEVMKHFGELTFLSDHRADLKKNTIPALILQCSEDSIASEKVGKYMKEQMPKSQITFLKAKGHCPHMSDAPETAVAMIDFLEKLEHH